MFEPDATEINAVIIASDILELKNDCDTLVNDPALPIRLNPFDLFCQKTGHKIGSRDDASLFALVRIMGKQEGLVYNIYNCTTLNVHPAWLSTDPESLDSLMESDPIGYAVYCLSLVTAQFYQSTRDLHPHKYPAADRLWALARTNALLSQQGIGGITELNVELARMVSFMPDATNHFFNAIRKFGNTPDKLAMLHCAGDLQELLRNSINTTLNSIGAGRLYANSYIKRTRFLDIAATPEDAARGPTNVRGQKVSKAKVMEAALFGELQRMFSDAGLDKQLQAENLPGSTAWRAKMEARRTAAQNRDDEIARELAALIEVSNLAIPESFDSDDDENTVEIRVIPIEEIAAELEQITNVIIPPAPKTLSALERLRAKKG